MRYVQSAHKPSGPRRARTARTARRARTPGKPKRAGVVAPTKPHSYFLDKALQIYYLPERTIESEIELELGIESDKNIKFRKELNSSYKSKGIINYKEHFELLRLIVYKVYNKNVNSKYYEALKIFMMQLEELAISLQYTTDNQFGLQKTDFYKVLENIKECYDMQGIESIPFYNNDRITLSNTELLKYLDLLMMSKECYNN